MRLIVFFSVMLSSLIAYAVEIKPLFLKLPVKQQRTHFLLHNTSKKLQHYTFTVYAQDKRTSDILIEPQKISLKKNAKQQINVRFVKKGQRKATVYRIVINSLEGKRELPLTVEQENITSPKNENKQQAVEPVMESGGGGKAALNRDASKKSEKVSNSVNVNVQVVNSCKVQAGGDGTPALQCTSAQASPQIQHSVSADSRQVVNF